MKRLVYIIFALTCCLISAQAQTSGSCGDNLTWQFADSTLTITGRGAMYDGAPWEHLKESIAQIRLPQGLTRVGSYAFAGCSHLRFLSIPNSVTSIGYEAFGHLPITTLTIPQGVTLIETYAFINCGSLTSVSLPNTLESLDGCCFQGCSSLTSITIPSSVTYMDQPFLGCSSLTSIVVESGNLVYDSRNNCNAIIETASGKLISGCSTTVIPQGVTSIEGLAFEGQAALTSITFPNSVLRIRGRAFTGCSSLNAITIPSSVQVIEDESFRGCSSLTSITVESGNNVYDSRNNCNAIIETATNRLIVGCQNTIIPNDVAIIAGSAFRNQSNLTSITIPEGVTTIGDWSFAESGLTSIVIPNSVTNLGWAAFHGCSSLRSVVLPNSLDTIQAEMFVYCPIRSIFLPSSVKHIKNAGFYDTPLSQIYLTSPTPVTLETEEVFICGALTCYIPTGTLQAYQSMPMWQNQRSLINFVEKDFSAKCGDNLYWTLQDSTLTIIGAGAMYDYSSYSSVPWYSSRSSIAHVSLPEGLTHIGQYAFYNHPKLNSITIPNSVTSIGNYAFYNCDGLTEVTISNNVTSIRGSAFEDCDGLTQVTIPNSVTSIGSEVFYGCDKLVTVFMGSGITTIGTSAFSSCGKLNQIRIDAQTPPVVNNYAFPSASICYVPVGCLEAYQAADWASMVSRFEEIEQQIKCADAAKRCMSVPSVVHYTIYGYVTELTQNYSWNTNTLSFWVADMPIGGRVLHAHNVVPSATTDRTPQKGDYVKLQGNIMLHDAMPATAAGCTMEILSAPTTNLTAQCGDSLYWMLADSTLTIVGSGMMYDYSTSAPAPWSELKNSFHTLVLPQGLTNIGDNAFADCAALQAVAIPTTITNIGTAAFQNCTALSAVLIPEGVQTIEDNAFKGCSALATVYAQAQTPPVLGNTVFNSKPVCYVPASTITSYQTSAWGNYVNTFEEKNQKCGDNLYYLFADSTLTIVGTGEMNYSNRPWTSSTIARVFLPDGLKSIGSSAFYNSQLTSIALPNTITTINYQAFCDCRQLTSIVLPDSITSIGQEAFYATAIYNNTANWTDGALYIGDYLIATNATNLPTTYTIKDATRLIADYAFSGSSIVSVSMPESVVSVGKYAFNRCTSLQSIRLSDNITSIGEYAFNYCSSLTTIHIPGSVKSIGNYAFYNCSKLAFVNLSEGIETIGYEAFYYCSKLAQITIPSTITEISSQAFYYCNALKAVYVAAATPPTLGSSAFNPSTTKCYLDCGLMTNYLASSAWCNMFGSFVEQCTQDIHTFDDAQKNAEWQFIQSGQTNHWVVGTKAGSASWRNQALYVSLDGNSFAYDHNAASTSWAYIPVTLTANDSISFAWRGEGEMCCDYIYAYLMPTNVLPSAGSTTLPDSAITLTAKLNQQAAWQHLSVLPNVEGNYNLFFMWTNDESSGTTSFAIDDVCIKSAESSSANRCGDGLYWTLADNTLTITGTGAMYEYAKIDMIPWYSQRTNIRTVVLPEGLTNISRNAFYGCTNLVSINIPSTLTSIASCAFYDCQYLRGPINIPEGATMVGDSTFYNCRRLSAISMPNNIDSIGVRAFYNCDSLTQLTLPDSLVRIKAYAFYDCDYIKRVVIPNNVTDIASYAFYSCAGLTTVTIGSRVDSLGTNVFNSCSALDTLYVLNPTPPILASNALYSSPICYVPTGSLSAYQSSAWANYVSSFVEQGQCGDNLYFTITNGTLSIIGSGAMYDYTSSALAPWYSQRANITTINLPDGLTSIGAWAFYDCDSISSISIPSTVTTIGNEAFYHCSNLTSVSIPDAVTTLGYEVLANCTLLTNVSLGSSVTSIGGYAFSYCPALEKLTLKSVTPPTIGDYIFSNSSAPACYVPCGTLSAYQSSAWATLVASMSEKCIDENYHDFETEQMNAQWQFAQSGQTNYWTIGTAAGSASTESSFAMYITNNGGYNYNTGYSSTSWAYLPITITATDSISFYWKGTGESSYDNLRVYLFPENTTPTAGSTSTVSGAQQLTSNYLSGQSTWQRFEVLPGVEGNYNLCFVWKNDGSAGSTPAAIDNVRIGQSSSASPSGPYPTASDLEGLYEPGQLCVCVYFEEEVCNDVVFAGTYNEWDISISALAVFSPLEGFDGWYWVAVTDDSKSIEGKPVQLTQEGTFNWDYQTGDVDSWQLISGSVTISHGYSGEADLIDYSTDEPVILISKYFKNHNSPCGEIPYHNYTIRLSAPDCAGADGTYYVPAIVGSFNNWVEGQAANEIDSITFEYIFNIYDREGGEFCFKALGYDGWTNSLLIPEVNAAGDIIWYNNPNIILDSVTVIRIDYSEGKYALCVEGDTTVTPAQNQCGDNLYWSYSSGTLTITGSGAMYDYESNENVPWKAERENITAIQLPDGITRIGNNAFSMCVAATSITIPNTVVSIGVRAFSDCDALQTVEIPYGVTTIEDYAFAWCDVLASFTMSNSLTTIGLQAVSFCPYLSSITIPSSVTSIGTYAFAGNSGLESISVNSNNTVYDSRDNCNALIETQTNTLLTGCQNTIIPNTVTAIYAEAFSYNYYLTSIVIPSSVASIGLRVFAACNSLTSIVVESGNTVYDSRNNCNAIIETVTNKLHSGCSTTVIPNSVMSIGNDAFFKCSSLTAVDIPTSVVSIGIRAFQGTGIYNDTTNWVDDVLYIDNCLIVAQTSLTGDYTIAEDTRVIADAAFASCTAMTSVTIPSTVTHIGANSFNSCRSLTSVNIPEGVQMIGYQAFTFCSSLRSIVVPSTVIGIDNFAFAANPLLESIVVASGNPYYDSRNNCNALIETASNTLLAGTNYTVIPQGVTAIWANAFFDLENLSSITIPSSVEHIYNYAFENCDALNTVYVEASTPPTLDDGAFTSAPTCYIPAGTLALYQESAWASQVGGFVEQAATRVIHDFESATLNAQWRFVQDGQTNFWTIGTAAGSASEGSYAMYVTNDTTAYAYNTNLSSVSWAYIPVNLVEGDSIFFNWKGTAESSYDYVRVYLFPTNSLPTAGSTTVTGATEVTTSHLSAQSDWQSFAAAATVTGDYNLCFMWKNDNSAGSTPVAIDNVFVGQTTTPTTPTGNKCGDNLYWSYSNGTLTITGSGAMYDSHEQLTYRQQSWFPSAVSRVNLPNGLTHIGATAFADCSNLTAINIPATVTSIGEAAFAWSGIERIELPNSVRDIYSMAFAKCTQLTTFIYRGTPSTLGNASAHMFLGCHQLDSVVAPASMWECVSPNTSVQTYYGLPTHLRYVEVTSGTLTANQMGYIDDSKATIETIDISGVYNSTLYTYIFSEFGKLQTLLLPSSLTAIPERMANFCIQLQTIAIPATVQEVGSYAFYGCEKMKTIDFASAQNLVSIGTYAFANCSTLVELNLPEGLQSLNASSFRNALSLVKVRMPSTLNTIGNYAFSGCGNLLKMNVAAYNPPTVYAYTFENVSRAAKVYVPEASVNDYKNTAIWQEFFIYSDVQDAVDNIHAESAEEVQKVLINGQVIIIRNGIYYNLMGELISREAL